MCHALIERRFDPDTRTERRGAPGYVHSADDEFARIAALDDAQAHF
ncbi:hypothetical protein GCM10022224_082680 [Nonomuraea antimicrobica]|uniref:Uncharacterized protein n=1 Tax=Nonomuraea antimicrobica TaxID=561173 RepID=A0ABP7DHI4_9ACTN